MRRIAEWLYRFAYWFESRFVQDQSADDYLRSQGYTVKPNGDVYYEGQKIGTQYKEGSDAQPR